MNTFPETRSGQRPDRATNKLRIIARSATLALLVVVLAACSAVRLGYNYAPTLAYWWIDDYVDLNDAQSTVLRRDIDSFFASHRTSELPVYLTRLQQWQQLAVSDSNPELACTQFEHLRAAYLRLIDRSLEPMARLALSLTPAQLQHLQKRHAKGNKTFESDFIRVTSEERVDNLLERATDRYETLYGNLSAAQLELLRQHIRQSPFDAQRVNTERLRRQTDLLKTLRDLQANRNATSATAMAALRAWHDRVMQSPLPGFAAYSETLVRNACDQFAVLHNSTSPEQRAHSLRVLKDYEADVKALIAAPL